MFFRNTPLYVISKVSITSRYYQRNNVKLDALLLSTLLLFLLKYVFAVFLSTIDEITKDIHFKSNGEKRKHLIASNV